MRGAHCDYVRLSDVPDVPGCKDGVKFVIKRTKKVRTMYLVIGGKPILAFLGRGKKFGSCPEHKDITGTTICKQVAGLSSISLVDGGSPAPTAPPAPGVLASGCPSSQEEALGLLGSPCDLPPSTKCQYGKECCCGECGASFQLECMGSWAGRNTEFCMARPPSSCANATAPPVTPTSCVCIEIFDPVCGQDGNTYSNKCKASCAGVTPACPGACPCNPSSCVCQEIFDPVCGEDGNTYENKCKATCAGVTSACPGACPCKLTSATPTSCICPAVWSPVCGNDGNTYSNQCQASCAGVASSGEGPC